MMHDSWCPLPWLSIEFRNNGDMRVCPHSHQGHDNGLLRKDDGTIYNGGADDIQEARNSKSMRSLRLDMLAGKWNPICKRCHYEVKHGIPSANKTEVDIWKNNITYDMAASVTAQDGTIDTERLPLLHNGLRFGNKCNIKCRSCNPTESDHWYEDYIKLWQTNTYQESFGQVELVSNENNRLVPNPNRYQWYDSDSFWQQMHNHSHKIMHVHMSGGEPTIIVEQLFFLQRCINMGIADKMIIEYNTNATAIPNRSWRMWEHFKEVRIGASIDGIGPINDYIRFPSDWKMVERNIDKFDKDKLINFNPWIASTVMIYNIWHIPDMLEWVISKQFDRTSIDPTSLLIWFHPLYGPKHLCAQILPKAVKQIITESFDTKLSKLHDLIRATYPDDQMKCVRLMAAVQNHLNKWSGFMNQDGDTSLMTKFWYFTDKLDEMRGQSMRDTMPEFYDMLKRYG